MKLDTYFMEEAMIFGDSRKDSVDAREEKKENRFIKELKELVRALFWALLIAGTVRSFIFEPFTIPSGSMIPTLLVGDYIYVDKYAYGYSRWSFPFGFPPFEGRVAFSQPKQGDIIVFKAPRENDDKYYIKRLIGLPGDRIQMKEGHLYVNDKKLSLRDVGDYAYIDEDTGKNLKTRRYVETLPNGVEHFILKGLPFGESRYDNTVEFIVPAEKYFMMGDNRDFSADSRSRFSMGDIPEDKLIGKALFIFYSTSAKWYQVFRWFSGLRYQRIFKGLYNLSWQKSTTSA